MEYKHIELMDEKYPPLLRCIPNPPERLYYVGNVDLISEVCISIVGSRKTSQYGKAVARNLAKEIAAAGVNVVSGMAAGIDTEAHKGALEVKGKTIAVLGCGIDICFPAFNKKLKNEIEETGVVISEYPPGVHGNKFTFPRRNRIISGLSLATVVVEAGIGSGALITAERAAEQSRYVFAVPGNINSISSFGTNKLIQDGANLLLNVADIFSAIGIPYINEETEDIELGRDEKIVLEIVKKEGEVTADFLSRKLNKKISEVNAIVTILEMKSVVYTAFGKIFVANY